MMKKTLITLFALAGVMPAADFSLLDEPFILCDSTQDVLAANGITTSDLFGYELNVWHCTYQAASLNDQSTVSTEGLSLQLGNVAALNKGNSAAVRFEAESPITLTFDIAYKSKWGNDSAFVATYKSELYGFTAEGTATLLDSWSAVFAKNSVAGYEGVTVELNFGSDADYASYGIIFSSTKTTAGAGGMNMNISPITLSAAAIPEPTTATLSLLALAGLAARRRRR